MAIPDPDPAAVKREFEAFKKDPATLAKFGHAAMTNGYFVAVDQARMSGSVGPALFAHEYRRYFDIALQKINEAQKETEHIRAALMRMHAAASNGSRRTSVARLDAHPDNVQFQEGLRVFQGWLASLYESYVTLFGLLEGTEGAARKVDDLASASHALIKKRQASGDMTTKGTELFKELTEL
jgi:hypothetical protein